MKRFPLFLLFILLLNCKGTVDDYTDFVDPFIGTDGHGHTYPGATLPFGMVQLSPDTRKDSWDGCSGYHYSDNTIMGFSHTHLSGTGVGDYGDIRIMPMTGELKLLPGSEEDTQTGYRSTFSHDSEQASPGYYSVFLEDYGVTAELTATERCGFHQYTFPEGVPAHVIIDLFESVTSDIILGSGVNILNDQEINGFRRTRGWAEDQWVFFHAVFSRSFDTAGIARGGVELEGPGHAEGENLQAYVTFADRKWEVLKIKVGISAVSLEGAKQNLQEEIPGWDFKRIEKKAKQAWNSELSSIQVVSGTRADRVKFYTALYHAFLAPNLFTDVDGSYRAHDGNIHKADGFKAYTVFSLWDTYRTLHPLMTIVQPERTNDFIRTLLDIYQKGGLLPVWELAGNETFCMIGYHSVPVILDAVMKGYQDFDLELAFQAMKHSAEQDHFGLDAYRKYGYIPADVEGESVSKTLEYAYDDWCIAMMAKHLGKEEEYAEYIQRAQYYKNLYDPETRFIRGKRNGSFVSPFDPAEVNFMLTEANTWQYTFYMPQDIEGMIRLMGGRELFSLKLDQMFTYSGGLSGRQQADITGLIGQYAHGNEPSHHVAYLYNYAGKPHKTQEMTRRIMDGLYGIDPAGLCGNEDCGQMSAWFVMSALGFYPVTPGDGQYIIGSPLFEEVAIRLPGNRKFTVRAMNNSPQNIYIQSATLNGGEFNRSYLLHEEVMAGGELVFTMGPQPSLTWGNGESNLPRSAIGDHLITPVPYLNVPWKTFRNEIDLAIGHIDSQADIFYRIGRQASGPGFRIYADTLTRSESFSIMAYAQSGTLPASRTIEANYRKIDHRWSVRLKYPYSSQYTGGGELALVDGETGSDNFRTGGWQGYYGTDVEAVIDMGRNRILKTVTARFLDDQNSWIFLPSQVEISVSDKPYDFKTIALINNSLAETDHPSVREFSRTGLPFSARYVKVSAKNIGTCPEWHKGAGGKAWLFIDEVVME